MIPHLRIPLRVVEGRYATVEQDSIDEIAQCVETILRTPRGQRLDLPDFGIEDQAFRQGGADLAYLRAQITEWEPRAADVLVERDGDASDLSNLIDRVLVKL